MTKGGAGGHTSTCRRSSSRHAHRSPRPARHAPDLWPAPPSEMVTQAGWQRAMGHQVRGKGGWGSLISPEGAFCVHSVCGLSPPSYKVVLGTGLEPARLTAHAPQTCVSTNSTTRASEKTGSARNAGRCGLSSMEMRKIFSCPEAPTIPLHPSRFTALVLPFTARSPASRRYG
jgi:hypothetical protein